MNSITIYRRSNTANICTRVSIQPVCVGSVRRRVLMQEDYIEVHFSTAAPINLKVGDFVSTDHGCFVLTENYLPTYNKQTRGVDYSLRLNADYMLWKNHKVSFVNSQNERKELNWRLTTTLAGHLDEILRNLSVLGMTHIESVKLELRHYVYTDIAITYAIDSDIKEGAQTMDYKGLSLFEALEKLAELYECEWWVEGGVIHFGTCIDDADEEPYELRINDNVEDMSVNDSQGDYANRLYVVGGTRNIPENYRKRVILNVSSANATSYGVKFQDDARPMRKAYFKGFSEAQQIANSRPFIDPTAKAQDASGKKVFRFVANAVIPSELDFSGDISRLMVDVVPTLASMTLSLNSRRKTRVSIGVIMFFATDGQPQIPLLPITPQEVTTGNQFDLNVEKKTYTAQAIKQERDAPQGSVIGGVCVGIDVFMESSDYVSGDVMTLSYADTPRMLFNVYSNYYDITEECLTVIRPDESFRAKLRIHSDNESEAELYMFDIPDGKSLLIGDTVLIDNEQLNDSKIPISFYSADPDNISAQGIAANNLRLPVTQGDEEVISDLGNTYTHNNDYIQLDTIASEQEVIEAMVELSDVFPREMENGTEYYQMHVMMRTEDVEKTYSDDSVYVEKRPLYYFRNTLSEAPGGVDTYHFDQGWVADGEVLEVVFQSGMLNGMTFEVVFSEDDPDNPFNPDRKNVTYVDENGQTRYNLEAQNFRIVPNENYGRLLPDFALYPKTGDRYLLTGWSPKAAEQMGLVSDAEDELLRKGIEHFEKMLEDGKTYDITLTADAVREQQPWFYTSDGEPFVTANGMAFLVKGASAGGFEINKLGRRVSVFNEYLGVENHATRVIGVEFPLDIPYDHPKITAGQTPRKRRVADLEKRINKIATK